MAKRAPGRTVICMCGDAERIALQPAAQNAATQSVSGLAFSLNRLWTAAAIA
jgi:hypothetical protein